MRSQSMKTWRGGRRGVSIGVDADRGPWRAGIGIVASAAGPGQRAAVGRVGGGRDGQMASEPDPAIPCRVAVWSYGDARHACELTALPI